MTDRFAISELSLGEGRLGICPLPGRWGRYKDNLSTVLAWRPSLVLTMTTSAELAAHGASGLGADLSANDIIWHHLPIRDFGAPDTDIRARWADISPQAQDLLACGGKVLAHCKGGCGRSGMMLLRLMVDMGEDPDAALSRLRRARACAVETDEQRHWASGSGL